MKKLAILSFTIWLLSVSGCTDRQVYEAMQKRGRVECQGLPDSQYEECIEDYQESYEDYRRALDEARDRP